MLYPLMSMLNQQLSADVVDCDGAEALHHALAEEDGGFLVGHYGGLHVFQDEVSDLDLTEGHERAFGDAAVRYPVIFLAT